MSRVPGSETAPGLAAQACCGTCRAFRNDAAYVEAQMPGLKTLGSGYGAVRADDGLCAEHQRYVAAGAICDRYAAREAQPG